MYFRKIVRVTWIMLIASSALWSCRKDNLKPGTPAFIKVEQFTLETNYQTQGTSSHKITDVWVYADDQNVGVFELPAIIPVLKNGTAKLRLEPGLKLNGIKTTRSNNPLMEPLIIEKFNFIPDSIIVVNPTVTYRSTTEFPWLEDFEAPSISIDTSNLSSKVNIVRTEFGNAFEGNYSGYVRLTQENNIFEAASFEAFVLPTNSSPVFLELNYKNDYTFAVGLFTQKVTEIIKKDIIFLTPKEDWNKIYINLTDELSKSHGAIDFKIFFRTVLSEEHESAEIYLDNIKITHR
jgi:hypothetical protein